MIVYKYTVKRLGQYYSLMNFGIDNGRVRNCPRYKLGKIYNSPENFNTIYRPGRRKYKLDDYYGYHFFKRPISKGYNSLHLNRKVGNIYDDWTSYFKRILRKDIRITILRCLVYPSYIIKENENRIVAKKFKVLGELI